MTKNPSRVALDHCVIHVSDWERSNAFYRSVLGAEVMPVGRDLCFAWPGTAEEAKAHLERCGVAVELGPVERSGARGKGRSVYFRDPDGSLLELISYPDGPNAKGPV